jgi:hypothetical protein
MAEQHGTEGAVQSMGKIDDSDIFKRAGHGASLIQKDEG